MPTPSEIDLRIMAKTVQLEANLWSLLKIIEQVAARSGHPTWDGKPWREAFVEVSKAAQYRLLADLEKVNPALSGQLSKILESARTDGKTFFDDF
jgi:hypothetical protein